MLFLTYYHPSFMVTDTRRLLFLLLPFNVQLQCAKGSDII